MDGSSLVSVIRRSVLLSPGHVLCLLQRMANSRTARQQESGGMEIRGGQVLLAVSLATFGSDSCGNKYPARLAVLEEQTDCGFCGDSRLRYRVSARPAFYCGRQLPGLRRELVP